MSLTHLEEVKAENRPLESIDMRTGGAIALTGSLDYMTFVSRRRD